VSGGLRPDNVADAVAHLRPGGVDVASGVEAAPGRKDPLLLRDFISNARQAHTALAARDPLVDAVAEEPYDWRDA
jgi:phosphoribosylanthranilate isomerase